jgi:hypothetical protein
MKLFRYRRPSLRVLLGITRVKSKIRKETGISTFQRYTLPRRIKQRMLQKIGVYSPTVTPIRQTVKGKFPTPLGLIKKKD